jgi:hypothetical protein
MANFSLEKTTCGGRVVFFFQVRGKLLGYLKDFQRTENKRMMMIQISSNIHPHHHLLHLYHHRRQRRRRRRRCRNRRLPRRRRPLCSYFPRLCLLLVNLPPFFLLSLFCDFLFS